MTDSQAIAASLDDPPAFGVVFNRHAAAIQGYLARRAGRDAEDLLSEVFLVAFERRHKFDLSVESARPWLFGIATVLLRAHARTEAQHLRAAAHSAIVEGHDGGVSAAGQREDASRRLRGLFAELQSLPARDRDVLLLYAWGDLNYEEIAEAMRVPVGTVRSRLNRARTRLRRAEINNNTEKERTDGRSDTAARF